MPENTLKFVVGIMLTSFGIFWGGEGAGADWPGADLALLVIAPFVAAVSVAMVIVLKSCRLGRGRRSTTSTPDTPPDTDRGGVEVVVRRPRLIRLRAFGLFWYDSVIGDDWQVAGGVVVAFLVTGALSSAHQPGWWLLPVVVGLLLPYSVSRVACRVRRGGCDRHVAMRDSQLRQPTPSFI